MPEDKSDQQSQFEGEYGKITLPEVQRILARHAEWLKLDEVERDNKLEMRADLSGYDLRDLEIVDAIRSANLLRATLSMTNLQGADLDNAHLEGASLFNAHLEGASLRRAHLRDTDLYHAHLEGAYLISANLQGAGLYYAHLEGADLTEAHLENAFLTRADLQGADLTDAICQETEMSGADLREAILTGADLKTAKSLTIQQLAGANLTRAKLPKEITEFAGLKMVEQISVAAKTLFISMLLACVYSWLTLAGTTDATLITNSSSSPLPLINASVPIVYFYVGAPLLIFCLFIYLHFYLCKLWKELADLPAIFPDGKRQEERTHPWLFNDLIVAHFKLLKEKRGYLSIILTRTTIFLAWWIPFLTIVSFWLRFLTRHDRPCTILHIVVMTGAMVFGY